ncbi:MAG: hypothetical protein JF603_13300 [Acidobacteria bacterium]|nr:hypothetical protein [Acidobacteriota bacterium]
MDLVDEQAAALGGPTGEVVMGQADGEADGRQQPHQPRVRRPGVGGPAE